MTNAYRRTSWIASAALAAVIPAQNPDWWEDWQVVEGFKLSVDTRGYSLPSSIAFVPSPGNGPKDPLYFVNELRGKIKVVTNDRSVHVFAADFFEHEPAAELPAPQGEVGLTGLCLEPENGYVFVTFNYPDERGILRNEIARFESEPGTFSLKHCGMTRFTDVLSDHPSAVSHMIGPLVVKDGALYVSVGDAETPMLSRNLDSPCGKVLRMSFDGDPLPDNPFYQDADRKKPRNYVWAYGLRNAFGLAFAGDVLCAADNGPGVDRFITLEKGKDCGYDGSDWSMGTNADIAFAPAVSPVQMCFVPADSKLVPEGLRSRFFFAASGWVGAKPGPGLKGDKSVLMVPYDVPERRVTSPAKPFLEYIGSEQQMPVGLALGPDALYLAPLFPAVDGETAILRIEHDSANAHPLIVGGSAFPLMRQYNCIACHRFDREYLAPSLEREALMTRIRRRLNEPDYLDRLTELDELEYEPWKSTRAARQAVRDATGLDQMRVWITQQLLEPRFDTRDSRMPKFGLTVDQAELIADALLTTSGAGESLGLIDQLKMFMVDLVPEPRQRHLVLFLGIGLGTGIVFTAGLAVLIGRRRRKRASRSTAGSAGQLAP